MSTASFVDMGDLWHPLGSPEAHFGVKRPPGAIEMATFFKRPSTYISSNGAIKGPMYTPFHESGPPATITTPWAEAPEGAIPPFDFAKKPEEYVPSERYPGYLIPLRFSGDELAVVRNFIAMLKGFLLDSFSSMMPEKLVKMFPTREDQKRYIDEKWNGWGGTYEDSEGNVRDAYAKVKTLQYLRDQSSKRYKRSETEFIRAREEVGSDGVRRTVVDDEEIDHTAITKGSRVKCMLNLDWISFSDAKKASERGPIYISFTANAVLVDPHVEVASIRSASTMAKLGFVSSSSAPETKTDSKADAPSVSAAETKADAAGSMEGVSDDAKPDLPVPPSAAAPTKTRSRKRAPPKDAEAPAATRARGED